MRRSVPAVAIALLLVLTGCSGTGSQPSTNAQSFQQSGAVATEASIGLAVGGAQDANAMRSNIRAGYVPQPTDITYAGLFHDYYFDTGRRESCAALFCPSYSRAVTRDPLSNETERYLTVGLNSGLSQAAFEREPLNLVVVVDTSGSMGEAMRKYYYDGNGTPGEDPETVRKIAAARDALRTLVGHLTANDRLGIVAYSDEARVVREVRRLGAIDRAALNRSIGDLEAGGSTNLDAGMRTARLMLEGYADNRSRETRIVYLTDAMPNVGRTDRGGLEGRLTAMAEDGIHTTFVGVGVDFNTRLVDAITNVRGANYYAIGSAERFRERMGETFAYMVTPVVYNLTLTVEAPGYRIEQVYGSPSADEATGRMLQVTTLFPSRREGNKTEGGVILVALERTDANATGPITLRASYERPNGSVRTTIRTVAFPDRAPPYYESSGIRKAVALTRYADLLRGWAAYERAQVAGAQPEKPPAGIEPRDRGTLGRWEQRSVTLRVSPVYERRFERFERYFERQQARLDASRMTTDLAILERLSEYDPPANATTTAAG